MRRLVIVVIIVVVAAAVGWLVADLTAPTATEKPPPSPVPEKPSPTNELPTRQIAYRELTGRSAAAVVELAIGETAIELPVPPDRGRFNFTLCYRRAGKLVEGVVVGTYDHTAEGLLLRKVCHDGRLIIEECISRPERGIFRVAGLEGLDKVVAHRITEAARQVLLLCRDLPHGRLVNGDDCSFGGEEYVASIPGDGTILFVSQREVGTRNDRQIYPRVRGALAEAQAMLDEGSRLDRVVRIYGSSAADGDDFELYRLELHPGD